MGHKLTACVLLETAFSGGLQIPQLSKTKAQSFIYISIQSFTPGSLLFIPESAFHVPNPLILRKRQQAHFFFLNIGNEFRDLPVFVSTDNKLAG